MTPTAVDKIKLWIFPTLVSIIGLILWQEIKEIKSDVKALLAQSNIDKTRIDNLERNLYNKRISSANTTENKGSEYPSVFYLAEFLPVKEEDLYEIRKS